MKCEYCKRPIHESTIYVTVAVSGEKQHYHAATQTGEDLSCWQRMIMAWSKSIHPPRDRKPAQGDPVSASDPKLVRVQRMLGASRQQ